MTQEIFCLTAGGAILASDSRVVREREDGERDLLAERKLFALGRRAAIVSGGAGIGILLSRELALAVQSRGLEEIEAILDFAPGFLQERYDVFLQEVRPWYAAHPQAFQRLYFLIAGCPHEGPPVHALLLGSESIDTPLTPFPMGQIVTMPRRLMLEARLIKLVRSLSLPELAEYCLTQLAFLAEKEPEAVGTPFDAVILTAQGLQPVLQDARTAE